MPKKIQKPIERRKKIVKEKLAKTKNVVEGVRKLANRFCVTERTIWRDLAD